jgi:hypothetical protein
MERPDVEATEMIFLKNVAESHQKIKSEALIKKEQNTTNLNNRIHNKRLN